MTSKSQLHIGYLMQNGAPDLSTISGPQLHVAAVVEGLQKLGHTVRTVATQQARLGWSEDLQKWFPPQFGLTRSRGFRWIESPVRRVQSEFQLPFIGFFDSFRYADACAQLLKGYDLLYERHGYMGYGGVIAARRLGIPLVIELNGNILKEIDEMGVQMSRFQRTLGRFITRQTLLAADHVVVVSAALKQELLAGLRIPEERISVVLNGVDLDLFTQPYAQAQVRAQYQIGAGPTLAFVGSFQPWHGVDLLVAAFQLVHAEFPNAQLVLIGDGAGRDAVLAQVNALALNDSVILPGRLPQAQVAAILQSADVLVAPYAFKHTEIIGTPLKLLEYLATGKAIVASTAPLHEVIQDGVTGLRVEPADVQALARGIARLLADDALRTQLGANAVRQAQNYSWAHVVQKLNGLFETELGKRQKGAASSAAHFNPSALDAQNQ